MNGCDAEEEKQQKHCKRERWNPKRGKRRRQWYGARFAFSIYIQHIAQPPAAWRQAQLEVFCTRMRGRTTSRADITIGRYVGHKREDPGSNKTSRTLIGGESSLWLCGRRRRRKRRRRRCRKHLRTPSCAETSSSRHTAWPAGGW